MSWGDGRFDQLGGGRGNTLLGFDPVPAAVEGLSGVTAVSAGVAFNLALLNDGTVVSWGINAQGQLGVTNSVGTTELLPVPVQGLTGVKAIPAGGTHSLALRTDGTVVSWGGNDQGQLGRVTSTLFDAVPAPVDGLSGATAISAGGLHSLALLNDRTVVSWGDNQYGQLGDGTRADHLAPTVINGLQGVAAISAGGVHSLAISAVAAPIAVAGPPYTVNEGSTIQLNGTGSTGNTLSYAWIPGTNLNDATLAQPTYTALDDSINSFTLQVTDTRGASAIDNTTVTVLNVAPSVTIGTPANLSSFVAGATAHLSASFTDPGTLDTHTCSVDWGDGATATPAVTSHSCGNNHAIRHRRCIHDHGGRGG